MQEKIAAIPEDQLEKKNRMENEIAFLELSVIIHKIFMQRQLNRNARLILGQETRKRDSLQRKCILSLNVNQEFERMTQLMKHLIVGLNGADHSRTIFVTVMSKDMTNLEFPQSH